MRREMRCARCSSVLSISSASRRRCASGARRPRDLASLRRTLEAIRPLRQTAPPAIVPLLQNTGDFEPLLDDLTKTLVDDPPAQLGDGVTIRPEADADLAECTTLRTDARSKLAELEARERERTGIKTLKVKYASPFGYAIEVSRSYAGTLPPGVRAPSDSCQRRALRNARAQGARACHQHCAEPPRTSRTAAL